MNEIPKLRFEEDSQEVKRLSRIIELMKVRIGFEEARQIADDTIDTNEQIFAYIVSLNVKIKNLKVDVETLENPLHLCDTHLINEPYKKIEGMF
jgi:hypothetical protein|tara:strand:- start:485 stop:766 length:282 start_codon:yes stop_codon:yes gene_type:complete